jgi:UDP-N-acetylmuramyl pentapeptide phosphotransferase/UDP-N-acetylglucosamine-1-phosphate transferase
MSGIVVVLVVSLILCGSLLFALTWLLPADFLLAGISSRSNHTRPARQIGGLAAVPAAIAGLIVASLYSDTADARFLLAAAAGAALLMVVGYADDRLDLPVAPRLACQIAVVVLFLFAMGPDFRVLSEAVPLSFERTAIAVVLLWFINMTNFMDGLDLMVVAGIGIPHALLALLGLLTGVNAGAAMASAAIAGAVFGFAPFNVPPARIFLGDSGSLAAGFLTGAAVLLVARHHQVMAFLPFFYFLADSTSVLLLRLVRCENVLKAHSSHAYQIARQKGHSTNSIAARVALLSLFCTLAAGAAILTQSTTMVALAVAGAIAATGWVIARMRGAPRNPAIQ